MNEQQLKELHRTRRNQKKRRKDKKQRPTPLRTPNNKKPDTTLNDLLEQAYEDGLDIEE